MKLHAVTGNTQKLDGGAMYGNAPRSVWEAWSPPDDRNRIALACRALLLETDDGRNILFEAGIGAFFEPKLRERYGVVESEHVLLKSLAALGFDARDIHAVVLSHLHFDHAGGLLSAFGDGEPRLVFSNAQFYVGATHWERAKAPHARDRASFIPLLNELLDRSERMTFIDDRGGSDLSPLVTHHFSQGHTVGLMLSEIRLADGPLVFASDLVPGVPWVHLPITMGYDRYPELLIDEKASLLERLEHSNGKLFFTHDPVAACAAVRRDEKYRYFAEPISLSALG